MIPNVHPGGCFRHKHTGGVVSGRRNSMLTIDNPSTIPGMGVWAGSCRSEIGTVDVKGNRIQVDIAADRQAHVSFYRRPSVRPLEV
jgi:hypothetical protein